MSFDGFRSVLCSSKEGQEGVRLIESIVTVLNDLKTAGTNTRCLSYIGVSYERVECIPRFRVVAFSGPTRNTYNEKNSVKSNNLTLSYSLTMGISATENR